jgi:uracil-DNA glycosylase
MSTPQTRKQQLLQELGIDVFTRRSAVIETVDINNIANNLYPETTSAHLTNLNNPADSSADIATLGWEALQARVASCRACALSESRTHTVFGVGDTRADWVVVGEAPGQQEDAQGEPFVGPSGKLLDAMLAAVGRSRSEASGAAATAGAYICNTVKCRPPNNRDPSPEEMRQCEPYLKRQLELLKPKVMLAMGRVAIGALLNSKDKISSLRGRPHSYAGVPLVVTYHPAYLLRNLPEKRAAWEDLCLAVSLSEAPIDASKGLIEQ